MPLESAVHIHELVSTNPALTDTINQGDDHLRLIKQVLVTDLGSLSGALTVTAAHINGLQGVMETYTDNAITAAIDGTGGVVDDYEAADAALQTQITANATDIDALQSSLTSLINTYRQTVYPVGSVYLNANAATNPATLLGFGSWQQIGQGRMLLGAGATSDGTETRDFTNGATGGKYAKTLTESNIPAHRHTIANGEAGTDQELSSSAQTARFRGSIGNDNSYWLEGSTTEPDRGRTSSYGGGAAFDILPPYLVVYIWKRIA